MTTSCLCCCDAVLNIYTHIHTQVGGKYTVDGRVGRPAAEALDQKYADELWNTAIQLTDLDIHPSLR
jgi:hypothetical protein